MHHQQLCIVQRSHKQQNQHNHQNTSQGQPSGSSYSWWHAPLVGYASSLLFVAAAFLINWLETVVDIHDYLIGALFVIATLLVAWIWGTGPALLALVVGLLCMDYLSIPPAHSFSFALWPGLVSLVPFLILQLLILWLIAKQKTFESQLLFTQQELAETNAQLKQADQVKDQFLSMASHELKTPVTSIHGYLQLLLRRLQKQSAQNPELLPLRDVLGKADEQTQRLTDLVHDLLDINSLRSGKMPIHLAPHDLRCLCREVVEVQQVLTGRSIDLRLPADPVVVFVDAGRLSQVVSNLVSNALKYSPTNTLIGVEVRQRPAEALIAVHNEGPVLSQEQQEAIFEPFYRSPDAQSSATPGWGLGLAISKEIVEQHAGRLWVESSKEKGTTFFVALPLPTSVESA